MTAQVVEFNQEHRASMKNGFTQLANDLLDAISSAPLTGRELQILMAVVRLTYGWKESHRRIAYRELSSATGIHEKNVGKVVRGLIDKCILELFDGALGINKTISDWDLSARKSATDKRFLGTNKESYKTPFENNEGVLQDSIKESYKTPLGSHTRPQKGVIEDSPYKYINKTLNKSLNKPTGKPVCPSAERTPTTEKKTLLDRVQEKHPAAVVASRSGKAAIWGEQIDEQLANLIAEAVAVVTLDDKRPNIAMWANEIRLMRTADERTPEQIAALFRFANSDDFWRSNILSPQKLRAKWGVLAAKFNERRHTTNKLDTTAAGTVQRLNDTSW